MFLSLQYNLTIVNAIKRVILLVLLPLFLLTTPSVSQSDYYALPLTGKWNSYEDPILLENGGLQDIQNMRRVGNSYEGIKGQTLINTSEWDSTYTISKSIFHYIKDNPQESHVIVQGVMPNDGGSVSILQSYSGTIPAQGNFGTTAGTTSSIQTGYFSNAPQGMLLYSSSGEGVSVYGGDETLITIALLVDQDIGSGFQHPKDVTTDLKSPDDSETVTIGTGTYDYLLIGIPYQINGITFYIDTVNSTSSTMTVKAYRSGSWTSVSDLVDNTASGGVTLAQNGTVLWTADTTDDKPLLHGYELYWYQVSISAGSAVLDGITVRVPFQDITNIWDTEPLTITSLKAYTPSSASYQDVTWPVRSTDATIDLNVGGMPAGTGKLYFGFPVPIRGLEIRTDDEKVVNTNAATATLKYWDGDSWVAVSNLDGALTRSIPLDQAGWSWWDRIARGSEIPLTLTDESPLYYYELQFDANLSANVLIDYIAGIPNIHPIADEYTFTVQYGNRSILADAHNGDRNKILYSAENTSYIYNGLDSGELYFGSNTAITAAVAIYNVYQSTGYEQLIVTKANETYRLLGSDPDSWEIQQITPVIGCIAPKSMAVCNIASAGDKNIKRHVAIWVASGGVVQCDGAVVDYISSDIRSYWDKNHADYISASDQAEAYGWFDPSLQVYKLLIGGIELEYSLLYGEWTKINRGSSSLSCGATVIDSDGESYSFATDSDSAYVYRLENGDTFNGTSIDKYIQTGDLLLDSEYPFFYNTEIEWFRLTFRDESSGTGSVEHWCDQFWTVNGTNSQTLPADFALTSGPTYTTDVTLGPCLRHSFKISSSADDFKLTGMGFVFSSYKGMDNTR